MIMIFIVDDLCFESGTDLMSLLKGTHLVLAVLYQRRIATGGGIWVYIPQKSIKVNFS